MAGFKIAKTKKIKILSKPNIDASRIVKIKKKKSGSTMYLYDFYFNADLREALTKNHLRLRFSVRSSTKQQRVSYFGNQSDPVGVLARLYAANSDNKNQLAESNRRSLIFKKSIDLTKYYNNEKLKNAKKLSDRSLFGTVVKTKTIDAKSLTRSGRDATIAQRQIRYPSETEINYGGFSDNYEYMLKARKDPSSASFPRDDETPADPRKRGTFVTPDISTGIKGLDGAISQIRNSFTGEATKLPKTSVSEFSDSDSVSVNVRVVDRVRLIKTRVRLSSRQIGNGGKFYICIEAVDSRRKTVGQKLEMRIDHSQNIEDYYVPNEIISLDLKSSFASYKKPLNGTISFSDNNIKGIEVYRRTMTEPTSYVYSRYSKLINTQFQNIETAPGLSIKGDKFGIDTKSKGRLDIFRALTVSKANVTYGNFSTAVVSSGPFLCYRGNFYTTSIADGIRLKILDVSRDVVGVCFMRRDLTTKERSFKKVQVRSDIDPNEATAQSDLSCMVFTTTKNSVKQPSCIDKSVKDDHLYEYKMKMYFKGGTSKFSPCSRVHYHKSPMKSIVTSVSDQKYTVETSYGSSRRLEDTTNKAYAKVTFNIDYEIAGNDTEDLLEILSSAGLSSLYTSDIDDVKEQLRSLITFTVERFNMTTGETFHLGTTASGEFVDDGSATPGPAPAVGQIYRYRCIPCLVSPAEASNEIQRIQQPLVTPNLISPTTLRDPTTLSTLQSSATSVKVLDDSPTTAKINYATSTVQKNFSSTALSAGMVASATAVPIGSSFSIGSSTISRYSTGDFFDFNVNTGYLDVSIRPGEITAGGHGGSVLRWGLMSKEKSSSSDVDYFVVICKKQGTRYIAGNCHGGNYNTFRFIDFTNKDFVGELEYSVIPVTLGGSQGEEAYIGRINQIDKKTEFLKGS